MPSVPMFYYKLSQLRSAHGMYWQARSFSNLYLKLAFDIVRVLLCFSIFCAMIRDVGTEIQMCYQDELDDIWLISSTCSTCRRVTADQYLLVMIARPSECKPQYVCITS